MTQYLVLSHVKVQNANSIAGLTWGFPAITQFLGFTHALNRKLSNHYEGDYDLELTGCGVISHSTNNKVYQPKKFSDFEFLQSKNPPVLAKHKTASPPIIEEGKMNLTISLVIELESPLMLTTAQIEKLQQQVLALCYRMRVAGGTVLNVDHCKLLSANTLEQHVEMLRKIKRLTMPGFVLFDRHDYLYQHYQMLLAEHNKGKGNNAKPQLLNAWLDFSALKFKAVAELKGDESEFNENTLANWQHVVKPNAGYLVPLMTGYKAISELYNPGQVLNTRDDSTSSCFVEPIHSVGEWKGVHSIKIIGNIIWRYQYEDPWYLCKQNDNASVGAVVDAREGKVEQVQELNLNDALNLF